MTGAIPPIGDPPCGPGSAGGAVTPGEEGDETPPLARKRRDPGGSHPRRPRLPGRPQRRDSRLAVAGPPSAAISTSGEATEARSPSHPWRSGRAREVAAAPTGLPGGQRTIAISAVVCARLVPGWRAGYLPIVANYLILMERETGLEPATNSLEGRLIHPRPCPLAHNGVWHISGLACWPLQ